MIQNAGLAANGRAVALAERPGPLAERRVEAAAHLLEPVPRHRQQRSTGAASIFSARQTVCARARAKVASGNASSRSASSISSFFGAP